MNGTVGILNVGCGDTKLVFDKNNPQECIRAARIVTDMLRRGYALLVEVPATVEGQPASYRRVLKFEEATCEYIIADLDPLPPEPPVHHYEERRVPPTPANLEDNLAGEHNAQDDQAAEAAAAPPAEPTDGRRGRRAYKHKRIPATGAKAVAVARTAGG